jgi:hypothetical protein
MTTTPQHDAPEQQGPAQGAAWQGLPAQGPPPLPPPPYYYGPYQQPPKKKHRVRTFLLISAAALVVFIGIIVGIVAAVGSGVNNALNPNQVATSAPAAPASSQASTQPAPTGPAMLSIGGQAQITENGSNAATVTVTSARSSRTPADPQFGSGPQNGYFVVVKVSVAADPAFTQGFDINPLDFYVLNGSTQYSEGNGNSFDALSSAASELNATTLGAGQQTTGPIVFDVSSSHGYVVYAPNLDGQPLAEWKF